MARAFLAEAMLYTYCPKFLYFIFFEKIFFQMCQKLHVFIKKVQRNFVID
jgi:hypothetical protein